MRKITMLMFLLITTLTFAQNANAGWSQKNIFGGYNYYGSNNAFKGYSQPNIFGGYNYHWKY